MSARVFRVVGVVLGVTLVLAASLAWGAVRLGPEVTQLRWERPWWLLLLAVVPIALMIGTIGEDRRVPRLRMGTIAPSSAIRVGWRARVRDVPGVLRAASLALFALALARPQSLLVASSEERKGIDIMIALDVSGSMKAADLKPTRLAAAQTVVQEFLERRNDDRIGAVVFAKDAYLLLPPTFDKPLLGKLIGKMKIGVVSRDGTAIGEGLGTALARLRRSNASSRVIILLTDGDNNTGLMSPETATGIAKKLGVKIYTVQMGNGDEVDVEVRRDEWGRPVYDRARFPVKPELLRKIASETGGEMYIANQTEELRATMHRILDQLPKTRFEAAAGDVLERFPFALVPGAILVIIEALFRAVVLRRFP